MPAFPRKTKSGACAACGAYGNTGHDTCRGQDRAEVIRLNPSRRARLDSRNSAAERARIHVERKLLRKLS
jgi:hypothetical protein